jgi:transposase
MRNSLDSGARVAELEADQRKLSTERDIFRAAAKYFAGETRW